MTQPTKTTVQLVQILPPEKPGDPAVEKNLGPFPSEAAAVAEARELAIAFARSSTKTRPAPTYRIVPG